MGILDQLKRGAALKAPSTPEAAYKAAQAGLRVFPVHGVTPEGCTCGKPNCWAAGKHPIARGWQDQATSDPEAARALMEGSPGKNLAVATGAGLLVLDIDTAKGGMETLKALEAKHGALPETLRVRTGSGGLHYYLRVSDRVGNSVSKLGPGVDVRGDGGLVVAPPSMHKSGGAYTWENWGAPVADAPGWLLADSVSDVVDTPPETFKPASLDILADCAAALRKHGPAIEGKGGSSHAYRAGALVFNDFALSEEEGWPLLSAWNKTCQPPFDEDADTGPDSLRERVFGKNFQGEHGRRRKVLEARYQMARIWPSILKREPRTDEEDVPAPIAEGDDLGQALAYARMEVEKRKGQGPVRERLEAFSCFLDVDNVPDAPKDYVVTHLVDARAFGILSGEPKTSKTWFGLETAVGIASGTRVAGEWEVPQKGRVALLLTEDNLGSARRRIKALLNARGLTDEQKREAMGNIFLICRKRVSVMEDEDLVHLMARCLLVEPRLILIDPLANLHSEEENDATAMGQVAQRLMWVRDIVDCTVLLTHHAGKKNEATGKLRGGQRMRGSSALHGHVEFGIYFLDTDLSEAPRSWINVVETETKDGPSQGTFSLRLDVEDGPNRVGAIKAAFGFQRETKPADHNDDRRVLEALELHERRAQETGQESAGMGLREIAQAVKLGHATVKRIIEDRLEPGGLVRKVMQGRMPKGYALVRKDLSGKDVASKWL
jgi:hypothetical protein